ncbi:tRNA (adenosine(37)-N6)-dimethylallyltransferase MiaA [bacterium]|nr:tRNA (adenosine(37)-N6)-dimethylallyltransferase MiaA [bacterium]
MLETIVLIGPTSIGKSQKAIEMAKAQSGEIISADAFQVYKGMDIGTAKVSQVIRDDIPHHFIDTKAPDEPYSVAEFVKDTLKLIPEIKARGNTPIICGGTPLYLRAYLYDYQFIENTNADDTIRKKWTQFAENNGQEALWNELNKIDPPLAKMIPPQNTQRIIRSLEIFEVTKTPPSQLRRQRTEPIPGVQIIGLNCPRDMLYEGINKRVDIMIEKGLVQEVEQLIDNYPDDLMAFRALGYKETIAYLKGSMSMEEMINLIKQKTRHYAKHQLTWFRKFDNVQWIENT